MNQVLLVWFTLGIQLANCQKPILSNLQNIYCKPQEWKPGKWDDGGPHQHDGKDDKSQLTKIADFFLELTGKEGERAAIVCEVNVYGAEIEAYWIDMAGEKEKTFSKVFHYSKENLRFGVRGKDQEKHPKVRVQVYGNKSPSSAQVTCGVGHKGKKCPKQNDYYNIKFTVRNQIDKA